MPRASTLKRRISLWLRLPISGPVFRLYAPRHRWRERAAEDHRLPKPEKRRVLIANLMGSLGDTVCYMALADAILRACPEAEVTWLVNRAMGAMVRMHPGTAHVLTVDIPASPLLRIPTIKSYYRLWRTMQAVRRMTTPAPFDVALVPRGGVDPSFSAHAVWMLNVGRSFGYSHSVEPGQVHHNNGDGLLTDVLTRITDRHEAMRPLRLLELSGLVRAGALDWHDALPIRGLQTIASRTDPGPLLHRLGVSAERGYVVISPGAGEAKRAWPPEKFQEVCRRCLSGTGLQVVLTGTNAEYALCSAIAAGLGPHANNCAGAVSLPELTTLLSHARIFVGNDSGTGHIAGALGIPTISLHVQAKDGDRSHINSPAHIRPVGPQVTVLQPSKLLPPCRDGCEAARAHCLDQISVDEVWSAMKPYLRHWVHDLSEP